MSLKRFNPDLGVIDCSVILDKEGIMEMAARLCFDLAHLAVESL